jgi:hypothetical protein
MHGPYNIKSAICVCTIQWGMVIHIEGSPIKQKIANAV